VRLAVAQAAAYWVVGQALTCLTMWVEVEVVVEESHLEALAAGGDLVAELATVHLVVVQEAGDR
jgi:hypothetical protein